MSISLQEMAPPGGGNSSGGITTQNTNNSGGTGNVGSNIGPSIPGGRMTHSLSTPSGVDGTPSTPRHRGGKKLAVRIQMLDDSVTMFQVQVREQYPYDEKLDLKF
ncbi:uncharacterized protein LOC129614038 isoform X2 [Condylostylus longicornis]|uniref:uncharacterized protein LOC129614038 isoform X2 n=1 Tax=Condylostylus longicornis TaxID=2530218 RepID=UPI00244DDF28|nr:uncharacterized protein LOC129614038 isoform X2 [Condylostylus longicornis]